MNFPAELRYTKSHEWAKKDGNSVLVGISDYAQKEISDVVFVELPRVGTECQAGKPICVVESVKAAFDIYAPVSGKITKVNGDLEGNPAIVNDEPYGKGWFVEIEASGDEDWNNLMEVAAYEEHLKTGAK